MTKLEFKPEIEGLHDIDISDIPVLQYCPFRPMPRVTRQGRTDAQLAFCLFYRTWGFLSRKTAIEYWTNKISEQEYNSWIKRVHKNVHEY